jgi:hypothetical protein
MPVHTINLALTDEEANAILSSVGMSLNMMALQVPSGQPATPAMLVLEAIQAELMRVLNVPSHS